MKKFFIGVFSLLLLSSCTTDYLKDDDSRTMGYEGKENKGDYKEGSRKRVTVKEPLIEDINEKAPDLVALPVEKVAIVELDSKKEESATEWFSESSKKDEKEFSSDDKQIVKDEKEMANLVASNENAKTAVTKNISPDENREIALLSVETILPEEAEKIPELPPKSPKVDDKSIIIAEDDEIFLEKEEEYSNILSLLNVVRFSKNMARLSNKDYDMAREVALINKQDGGRIKVIAYAPVGRRNNPIYKNRKENVAKAVNKFGVKKNMIISDIEETNVKDLLDAVEIYIEY